MTRFWNVELGKLCDQHLLGLHKEIHQEIGSLRNGRIEIVLGHIKENQITFENIIEYHEDVEEELRDRGFNADSPIDSELEDFLEALSDWGYTISEYDRDDLSSRCGDCSDRLEGKPLKGQGSK